MRRLGVFLSLLLLASVAFVSLGPTAQSADGGATTVQVEGTVVTITVNVVFLVVDLNDTPPDLMRGWEQAVRAAEDYWNRGLANHPFKGCFTLRIRIAFSPVELYYYDGSGSIPGHLIRYAEGFGLSPDPNRIRPEISDPVETDPTKDSVGVYQGVADGFWPPWLFENPRDVAHEVGHLLGIGDDYHSVYDSDGRFQDIESTTGREGTLMDRGDAVDQALVDRLGNLVEKSGVKLPRCWSGTVQASSHTEFHAYGGYLVCTENWNLTLSFTVDESGSIAGSGTGAFDSLQGCRSSIGWTFDNATTLAFDVKGTETDSELLLRFYETAIDGANEGLLNYSMFISNDLTPPVLVVPRVGVDRAEGTVTISNTADNGQTADGSHVFSLTCADCH
jgi:hypothetical protein